MRLMKNPALLGLLCVFALAPAWADETQVFLEAGDENAYQVRRGWQKQAGEHDGRQATRFTWGGDKRLMEIIAPQRPDLIAFGSGVKLEVEMNTDTFADLRVAGVRVVDLHGDIHQYGKLTVPEGEGWKTWEVDLSPDKVTDRWGGPDAGRGQIDPPVKLLSLVFNAPDKSSKGKSILIGEVRRNAFDPDAIEPQAVLAALGLKLETASPLSVILKGQEDAFIYRISNPAQSPEVGFRLKLALTDYAGHKTEWVSQPITLKPGGSEAVALGGVLPKTGWYKVEPTLELIDGSAKLQQKARQVAYIDAVGIRDLPPADGFYFGVDSRRRSPEIVNLLAQLGVDMLRFGTWSNVNTNDGGYKWTQYDEVVTRIRDAGMQVLYSFTFTPQYAVKPEYKQRHQAGEKINGKPIKFPNVAPAEDALRQAVRTIVAHNQEHGLRVYDLWNEPDLAGFWQGTTDEYLDFMRICYEEIKSVQPDAVVLSGGIATLGPHGGHGLNPDMIERMIVEGQDHYDAISVHIHGSFRNFQEQIDGPLAELRARLKQDKPLWFTETGYNGNAHAMAQELVKKFTFARARGAKGFIWYALYGGGNRSPYNMTNRGGDAQPVIPAYNEMTRLMRGKTYAKQHDVGRGYWLLAFEGNKQTLMIGWEEDAESTGRVELIRLAPDAEAQLLNVMGDAAELDTYENLALLPLTKELRYLLVNGQAEVLGAPVLLADSPRGEVGQMVPVTATLHNPLQRAASFELDWTLPDGAKRQETITVEPTQHAQASIDLTIPRYTSGDEQPRVKLAYRIAQTPIAGTAALVVHAVQQVPARAIDQREPDFVLGADDQTIFNPNAADPTRAHLAWGGAGDLSAKVWLALDGDALLVRAHVTDQAHRQPHEPANAWQADGLQLALALPGRGGVWNIGLSRDDEGKDHLHAWQSPVGKNPQGLTQATLKTTPKPDGMAYDLRIPFDALGADAEALRSRGLRINLLVNDDDGDGRKGYAHLAPGMGRGTLDPEQWPMLLFE